MSKESYLDILETKSTEPNKNEIKVYYNNIDPYSSFSPKKKFSLTSKYISFVVPLFTKASFILKYSAPTA